MRVRVRVRARARARATGDCALACAACDAPSRSVHSTHDGGSLSAAPRVPAALAAGEWRGLEREACAPRGVPPLDSRLVRVRARVRVRVRVKS